MSDAIRINGERLWSAIERSGKIGVGRPGGLKRLALSDADREMRDLFVSWCREAGCAVTIDRLGSIFARREGADARLPPVMIGSHLDTQVNGGKYDGVLGVLAGLEVIRTLNERGVRTRRSIELVSWTNEEGARFSPPMVASGAFAGVYSVDWVLERLDDEDKRFGDELARIGYAGGASAGHRPLDAYFELHIEQGPILDAEGIDVGVVTKGYAVRGFLVEVRGETSHTGPTPMDQRRNALVGAAMLAVAVNDVGWRYHPSGGKATASWLLVKPNQPGILSDWSQLICDVRHEDPAVADRMAAEVLAAIPASAERSRCEVVVIDRWTFGNERFDPECVSLIREAARQLDIRSMDIASQAGHDAYHIAKIAPMAMIFTPCRDGITHNNREQVELARTVPGVNALLHAVLARANR